jgi:hypothetical protein
VAGPVNNGAKLKVKLKDNQLSSAFAGGSGGIHSTRRALKQKKISEIRMETERAYLERKYQELILLNDCLRSPLSLASPRCVKEVIEDKFRLTSALRAQHDLDNWTATETAWSQASQPPPGPFQFKYDYQRADLEVRGPSFYQLGDTFRYETIYTGSGMAAISAVLLASANVAGKADILVLPGSYSETSELIESYARELRPIILKGVLDDVIETMRSPRILLLDSSSPAVAFEGCLKSTGHSLDLLIFDTTCFSNGSGQIRRVLSWAQKSRIPVVMVRSHTKLDSLGAEYGRLGSAAFVHERKYSPWNSRLPFKALPNETRKAVRLFGGAALPAHFPPYVGKPAYHSLTKRRAAAILRNARRTTRYFRSKIEDLTAELHFIHGLYVTLSPKNPFDETAARQAAAKMSEDLAAVGFPIRHAGSFGFDFAATEWGRDPRTGRYVVRVAVSDLPTEIWDDLAQAIARWWIANQRGTEARQHGDRYAKDRTPAARY